MGWLAIYVMAAILSGLRDREIARGVGCYLAFWFAPEPVRASAICGVVVLSYLYSLVAMRKPGAQDSA